MGDIRDFILEQKENGCNLFCPNNNKARNNFSILKTDPISANIYFLAVLQTRGNMLICHKSTIALYVITFI